MASSHPPVLAAERLQDFFAPAQFPRTRRKWEQLHPIDPLVLLDSAVAAGTLHPSRLSLHE
jgi:hypothetical protein